VSDICIPKDDAKALEDNPPSREDIDKKGCVIDGGEVLKDADGNCYDKTGKPIDKVENVEGALLHTRCPHPRTAVAMAVRIKELRAAEDSTGGVATTVITKVPVGLGEPVFDKAEAELAKAMMSLPATKGFEIGEGFACAAMNGSKHNDLFVAAGKGASDGLLDTATNHAGGTLGGITTGKNIVMRVAIKPASSIAQPQQTATYEGENSVLEVKGRHDPCVLPRAPPLLEGLSACAIMDLVLRQRSRTDQPLVTLEI
jgi:chorismate synthase